LFGLGQLPDRPVIQKDIGRPQIFRSPETPAAASRSALGLRVPLGSAATAVKQL
jgi:hypothetical protein